MRWWADGGCPRFSCHELSLYSYRWCDLLISGREGVAKTKEDAYRGAGPERCFLDTREPRASGAKRNFSANGDEQDIVDYLVIRVFRNKSFRIHLGCVEIDTFSRKAPLR